MCRNCPKSLDISCLRFESYLFPLIFARGLCTGIVTVDYSSRKWVEVYMYIYVHTSSIVCIFKNRIILSIHQSFYCPAIYYSNKLISYRIIPSLTINHRYYIILFIENFCDMWTINSICIDTCLKKNPVSSHENLKLSQPCSDNCYSF